MGFDYEAVTWGGGDAVSPDQPDFLDHSLHLRYALDAIKDAHGSVLEIGCGSGRFIDSVAQCRPDLKAFGCDVSETALNLAKARHRVHFQRAPAEELPYSDGQFDAVLMIDVLEHLPQMEAGLREVRRVLAPQGTFHLVFPCEGNPLTLHGVFSFLHGLKKKHAGHLHRLGPKQLLRLLEGSGLQPVQTLYSYHLLGQLYDAAIFGALGLGFNMHELRREKVESAPSTLARARKLFSRVLYAESTLFKNLPWGMTVHVTCK